MQVQWWKVQDPLEAEESECADDGWTKNPSRMARGQAATMTLSSVEEEGEVAPDEDWLTELGQFEVSVSLGDEARGFHERMGAVRVVELQRALRDEVGVAVFEKHDLEQRLRAVAKGEAAGAIQEWLRFVVGRDLTRKTASLRKFVDGDGDGFDDEVSVASFLLMGAQATTARFAPLKRERLCAVQPLSLGETVAWSWAQASKVEGVTVQFRAWFATPPSGQAFAFPFQGGLPENAAVVEQDEDTRTWRAEATGDLYLTWESRRGSRSRSLLPSKLANQEVDVALKMATCDAGAAEAAQTAAAEFRELRSLDSFGERLWRAPATSCDVKVEEIEVEENDDLPVSLTGLNVRANLRKAAQRLQALTHEAGDAAQRPMLLRQALATVAALEDEVAAERARADRAVATAEKDREKNDADRRKDRAEREELSATIKHAEDRAARAEAKIASAIGALQALVRHELHDEYDDEDDDRQSYNPFVGAVDPEADRAWSRLACGDEDVDNAAASARAAAKRTVNACARARAYIKKTDADKARLVEEKRVLIAELRRLRLAADDRLAEVKADADEARMVQRQFAAHVKKLKDERRVLAKRLAQYGGGAASADVEPSNDEPSSSKSAPIHDDVVDEVLEDTKKASPSRQDARKTSSTSSNDRKAPPSRTSSHDSVDVAQPRIDDGEDRVARRAALDAKLQGCRECVLARRLIHPSSRRQNALQAILQQQPNNPKIVTLKGKLEQAIVKYDVSCRVSLLLCADSSDNLKPSMRAHPTKATTRVVGLWPVQRRPPRRQCNNPIMAIREEDTNNNLFKEDRSIGDGSHC